MSFQLSPNVDENKIFLVNLSSCKTRIDPYYYKPEFSALRERLENHPSFQRVGSLIKSWNRGDGPRDGFYTDDAQTGVYFLRVNNLKNHTIDTNEIKYITRYVHENTLKRAQVTAGDVVFAISGTKDNLGTVSVILRNILEANLNSALVKLELDWSIIDKRYFCYMFDLNITRIQIDFIGKGAAQNNLNNEEISQIHIFLPSISEQDKIVRYLDEAHFKKKQKEAEAQRSLDSIDDYLLSELGIALPEPEENTIQNRIFYRKLSQVSGGRFDSEYYHLSHYQDLENLKKSPFSLKRLVDVCHRIVDGPFGSSVKAKDYVKTGIPFIRVADVTNGEGYLKTENLIFISEEAHKKIIRSRILPGDVVIAKTGATMGAACVVPENFPEANIRGDLAALTVKNEQCLSEYVVVFINTKIGQRLFWRLDSGGTRGRVVIGNLEKLPIVVPPLDIQENIVNRVEAIRTQAKQLRQSAAAELEQAKQEVEAMILGERGNKA